MNYRTMAPHNCRLPTGLLLALQIILVTVLVQAQNTNFSFTTFHTPDSFLMVDDIQHSTANSSFLLNSRAVGLLEKSCGRLLYKDKVRIKDSASGAVASFQTAFTFQITGPLNWNYYKSGYLHGDGLVFTFLKNDTSDSHVGVNVNSVHSTWSYNLCGGTVRNCSCLCYGGYFTAWIDYNSTLQKLEVFFANGSPYRNIPKPLKPLIEANLSLAIPLAELVDDYMYVGFSASTGTRSEVHQIQSWTFISSGMPELNVVSNGRKVSTIVGVSVGAVAALLVLGFFIAYYRRRTSYMKPDKFNLVDLNLVPRMFTYKELSKATKNFSRSELLGSGGFGAVYKGTLPSVALVAVKQMKHGSKHGEESFQAEAASLSQIRHRNLVQLRGWCHEEERLFLVYDYMCNGILDEWLFHFSNRLGKVTNLNEVESLPLTLRYSVLSGVASALSYLHEECVQCVLHRDIKSSNVLLDAGMNAYLGDFGLARLIDHQKTEKTTMMAGTLGYMAPEMPHTGRATKESDVYSFGVLMLEVMCGMRPLDVTSVERGDCILVDRVWRAHEAGNIVQVADSRLGTFPLSDANSVSYGGLESQEASLNLITRDVHDVSPSVIYAPDAAMEERKMIMNLLHLGLLCCNPNPEERPSTRLVSQLLQSSENMEMSMSSLPIRKPHAHYSKPGFSQILDMRPAADSTSSSVLVVQEVAGGPAQGSSQSIPPSSGVSSGESVSMQSSFVATSGIFSGR